MNYLKLIWDARVYKAHLNFSWVNQEKKTKKKTKKQNKKKNKRSTNIKRNEITKMNIINDITFNLHNKLLINDNRYMKVTLKSKLIGVAKYIISNDYREF